ncbi:hypothetical protein [Fontivita pretiosa]|uniref:hypothetical protein n=1 Tax=Fontivita pretiosa TaxID=2989684 RepID=UPI003D16589F
MSRLHWPVMLAGLSGALLVGLGCELGAPTGRRAQLLTAAQGSMASRESGSSAVAGAETGRIRRGGDLPGRAGSDLVTETLVPATSADASFASHIVGDTPPVSAKGLRGNQARAGQSASISKQDVLSWTARGLPEDAIIDRIQSSHSVFVLTAADENELRDHGVSEAVIRALRDTLRR